MHLELGAAYSERWLGYPHGYPAVVGFCIAAMVAELAHLMRAQS